MPRTLEDLRTEVLAHGFDAGTYTPLVTTWLNEGLGRMARRIRLPQLEATSAFSTAQGQTDYPLPPELARVRTLRLTDDADPLEQIDLEQLDGLIPGRGKPEVFALTGQYVRVFPTPDRAYALELRYWLEAAELVNTTDAPAIPDDYADLLVTYALWKGYRMEDDFQAAMYYRDEFDRELALARSDLQERSSSHVRQVQGLMGAQITPRGFQRP